MERRGFLGSICALLSCGLLSACVPPGSYQDGYYDGYYDGRRRPPRGHHHKDRWDDRPPHGRAYGHRKKRFDRDDWDD